jgi:hypothetical protein
MFLAGVIRRRKRRVVEDPVQLGLPFDADPDELAEWLGEISRFSADALVDDLLPVQRAKNRSRRERSRRSRRSVISPG